MPLQFSKPVIGRWSWFWSSSISPLHTRDWTSFSLVPQDSRRISARWCDVCLFPVLTALHCTARTSRSRRVRSENFAGEDEEAFLAFPFRAPAGASKEMTSARKKLARGRGSAIVVGGKRLDLSTCHSAKCPTGYFPTRCSANSSGKTNYRSRALWRFQQT